MRALEYFCPKRKSILEYMKSSIFTEQVINSTPKRQLKIIVNDRSKTVTTVKGKNDIIFKALRVEKTIPEIIVM